jgi:subtilisin family serine protease
MYRFFRLSLALVVTLSAFLLAVVPVGPTQADASETYIVVYQKQAVPRNAGEAIAEAGGTLVHSYDEIGVAIAHSGDDSFGEKALKIKGVESVAATAGFATQLDDQLVAFEEANGPPPGDLPNWPVLDSDPFFFLQWDMHQIRTLEAHAVTGGSPSVVVGIIDTGIHYEHPDLLPNIDFANSVSCLGGVPDQDPAVWSSGHWHGTHVAGTVAAAVNGYGIVGVAPNVKLAAIQAGNAQGYFFPEAVVCAFMWAGDRGLDVTNSSYYVDPWLFNCRNDPGQRAIWKAIQRAIRYAMQQGVTVVASAGNENADLAHPAYDDTSPDYPPGSETEREITNACVVLPVEVSGVIGVSANGAFWEKAYYSSYGVGAVDVVAPGGDRFQLPLPYGFVLSTYPPDWFAWAAGTSMAAPHASGVAALAISQYGRMQPGRVEAMVSQTAVPVGCPPNPFVPGGDLYWTAHCQGGEGYNSFYGHGQVDAYNAVTHGTGNQ